MENELLPKYKQILKERDYYWEDFVNKNEFNSNYYRHLYKNSGMKAPQSPTISNYLYKHHDYKIEYPDNKKFAVCLTHDIDQIYRPLYKKMYYAFDDMRMGDAAHIKYNFKRLFDKKYPLENIDFILVVERKYGANSSFYFLTLENWEKDYNYSVGDLHDMFDSIIHNNGEIGLHGGHNAFTSYEKMKSEKDRLEEATGEHIVGYRNHYLKFDVPETWHNLVKCGFIYDTTYGYVDYIGFRNNLCYPFMPYDIHTNKEIDIIEVPLVVMDCSMFDKDYMGIGYWAAYKLTKLLIDHVRAVDGVFTLSWHNSYMTEGSKGARLYEDILKYCYDNDAWMTNCKNVVELYKKQDKII